MSKEFLTTFNPTWQMNVFDLIVYLALAWAVFNGWRRGFLLQLLSLVAVVAGVYVAIKYGSQAGALLGLEGTTASIIGFSCSLSGGTYCCDDCWTSVARSVAFFGSGYG